MKTTPAITQMTKFVDKNIRIAIMIVFHMFK